MSKKLKVPKYAMLFLDAISHLEGSFSDGTPGFYRGCCGALGAADNYQDSYSLHKAERLLEDLFCPSERLDPGWYWFGTPNKRNLPKRVAALKKAYRIAVKRHNAKGKK